MSKNHKIYIHDLTQMIADTLAESSPEYVESIAKQTLEIKDISYDMDGWFNVEWEED